MHELVPWRAASAYRLCRDKETARGMVSAGLGMMDDPPKGKGAHRRPHQAPTPNPGKVGRSTRQLLLGGAGGFMVKEAVSDAGKHRQGCHSCPHLKTETWAAFPIKLLWGQKPTEKKDAQVSLSLRC